MIVGRGGGSIEDLWAFNEESVAQAVFDCSTPIISAVGHETDTTIIDYVADLRAPTPSAAAELAVYDVFATFQTLNERKLTLSRLMRNKIEVSKIRLQTYQAKLQMNSPMGKIRERKTWLLTMDEKLAGVMRGQITKKRHQLEIYIEKLKGLSPLDKLNQGFSYVSDEIGKTVTDVGQVELGDSLKIQMKNGLLKAIVTEKSRNEELHG